MDLGCIDMGCIEKQRKDSSVEKENSPKEPVTSATKLGKVFFLHFLLTVLFSFLFIDLGFSSSFISHFSF